MLPDKTVISWSTSAICLLLCFNKSWFHFLSDIIFISITAAAHFCRLAHQWTSNIEFHSALPGEFLVPLGWEIHASLVLSTSMLSMVIGHVCMSTRYPSTDGLCHDERHWMPLENHIQIENERENRDVLTVKVTSEAYANGLILGHVIHRW